MWRDAAWLLDILRATRKALGHVRGLTEADMQRYFQVSPPSVHHMVGTLEKRGHIARVPRQGRSIRLLLHREKLPDLE